MQIGLFIDNLAPSQLAYCAVGSLNQSIMTNKDDGIVFVKDLCPPSIKPFCACVNYCESIVFDGLMIATTLDLASFILKTRTKARKIFYVWDLEWLRGKTDFKTNVQVYRDKELTLIARSQEHARAIEEYCNRPVDLVIPNCNILEIRNEFCSKQ